MILKTGLLVLFSIFMLSAKADTIYFKPKATNEDFLNDKALCVENQIRDSNQKFQACMEMKNWQLIDKNYYESLSLNCKENNKNNSDNNLNSQVNYYDCMNQKGFDVKSKLQEESEKWEATIKSVCVNDKYKEYFKKTTCFTKDLTFDMLVDKSKITNTQKKELISYSKEADLLQKQLTDIFQNYGGIYLKKVIPKRSEMLSKIDANKIDLFNEKITWGEFNKRRKDITAEVVSENAIFKNEANDELKLKSANLDEKLKQLNNASTVQRQANIKAMYTEKDVIYYFLDSKCEFASLNLSYPYKLSIKNKGESKEMGSACYTSVESAKKILISTNDGKTAELQFNQLDGQRKTFSQTIDDMQRSQQANTPPPPNPAMQPGLTQRSQPIDPYNGARFKPQQNCNSMINGNMVNTTCN